MAAWEDSLAECPPCNVDALFPVCRALAVNTSWNPFGDGDSKDVLGTAQREDEIADLFSTRCPRDAFAGVASGAKTTARSLAAGLSAFVSGPLEGYQTGSPIGLLQSVGTGTTNAVLLPCAGLLIGTAQCVRGFANTPEAVAQAFSGKIWCDSKRCWVHPDYDLKAEVAKLESTVWKRHRDRENLEGGAGANVTGVSEDAGTFFDFDHPARSRRAFYDLLQVAPTANMTEIRRAYYRECRRCHPDKAGSNDPSAVEKFQRLSEAYEVLRRPELRRVYDLGGSEAVHRMSTSLDIGVLYSTVLSNTQWKPFLGRLALSRILSTEHGFDRPQDPAQALVSIWCAGEDVAEDETQVEREVHCAKELAELLQLVASGQLESFHRDSQDLAARLASTAPFGPAMLAAVAAVYENEATAFLGALRWLDPQREIACVNSRGRLLKLQSQALHSGVWAVFALRSLFEEDSAVPENNGKKHKTAATTLCLDRSAVQVNLPALASALWRVTVLDVEGTLRRVCRRVLRDSSCPLEVRIGRASGLRTLAAAFNAAATAQQPAGIEVPGDNPDKLLSCIRDAAARLAANVDSDDDVPPVVI